MQVGLQRQAGYQWKGYESVERRYRRRAEEIRADAATMREVRALAAWLLDVGGC